MRWTATAPVTWPSQQGWDAWWAHQMQTEFGMGGVGVADSTGVGELDDAAMAQALEANPEIALVAGQHLRPGAIYQWVAPEGFTRARLAGGIGGHPERRSIYAEYQEVANPKRRVEFTLDSLESFHEMSGLSTLKHLGGAFSFRPERDQLLDVEVKLDWLLVRLRARVDPAESGEQLRVRLQIVGRGLWKPVVASLLVPLGIPLRNMLTDEVEGVADRLTHLEEDPRGDGAPEREMERIEVGAELIRSRLHEVVSTVDARPFWRGRGKRALQEAFDALPALGPQWPPVSPAMTFGDSGRWWDEEKWIFDMVLDRDPWRRKRHAMVDEQVDFWLAQQRTLIDHREQAQAKHRADQGMRESLQAHRATAAELEEMLDLSWLSSPWSAFRFMAKKANEDEPDPDLPPLETDEDARKFVTKLIKDL